MSIGDRVSIAPNVMFFAEINPNNSKLMEMKMVVAELCRKAPIVVEADAWIGAGAIILPGVTMVMGL